MKKGFSRTIRSEHYPDIRRRYEAGESTISIGKFYDNKDHTTILYHLRKMGVWKRRGKVVKKERGVNVDAIADLPCSFEGCAKMARTRGLCQGHYMSWYQRNGREVETAIPRCEHKDSRCECVNLGKANYNAYVTEANSRSVKRGDN